MIQALITSTPYSAPCKLHGLGNGVTKALGFR